MILKLESNRLQDYLSCTEDIDYNHEAVRAEALRLANSSNSSFELVKNSYEYVRDTISHSADIEGKTVTCKASEVLAAREGLCYAKSHLLAALLRSNGIPTGFCYQLLRSSIKPEAPLVLHGLNAVFMQDIRKWIRLDPRGNKCGINAQFSVTHEQLAYQAHPENGEIDFPIIFASPDDTVIFALNTYKNLGELWQNLPQYPAKMDRL